jgi:sugar phosphate isomerase/epimerase
MHPVRADEPLETTLAALRGYVVHSHIHDGAIGEGTLEMRRIGAGDVPHAEPIKAVLADGYQGFFSLEYIGEDWDKPDELLPQFMTELLAIEEQIEEQIES